MDQYKIKVLLVEDDLIDQMAFKRTVKTEKLNYDYQVAGSVKKAAEILEKESFDIVITDYNLGDGTGFDIFSYLKDTPIIFTTGAGDEEIAVHALKAGAYDYLIKDQERIYLKALPEKIENATLQKKYEQKRKRAAEALRKSEEQFRVLFENSPDAIFVEDEEGYVLDINPSACKLHAMSREDLIGKHISELVPEHMREEVVKSYQKWFTGDRSYRESTSYRSDGTFIPVEIRSSKIQFSGKNALLLLVRDITERKQAEEKIAQTNRELKIERDKLQYRLEFEDIINSISTRFINLTSTELHDEINIALGKISVFTDTDRSYVFLFNDDLTKMSNIYEWCAEGILCLKEQLQDIPTSTVPWWMNNLKSHETIYIPQISSLGKEAKEEKKILEAQNIISLIVLPMVYEKKLIGFIGFDAVRQAKVWDIDSIKLLQIISESIVNAMQRKKAEEKLHSLYQSLKNEVEIASSVQRYLLPEWLTLDENVIFSSTYTPSIKVGGDLFDIIPITSQKYIVYVGDISGHGVQAALMMTAVKSIINMIIENNKNNLYPYYIINRLNNILCKELFHENYMTILLCLVDLEENTIRYYNAGHPPLIQFDLNHKKTIVNKEKGSVPVGWSSSITYAEEEEDKIDIDDDKIILLYTDGIFECENNEQEQLGINGFQTFLEKQHDFTNCLTLPHRFKQNLIDANYDISADDFTLVTFRKRNFSDENKMQRMFRIRSLIENTGPIGKECEQFIESHLHNTELAAQVELIVNEFLNNIIEHGLKSKKDTIVIIEVILEDDIRITFWDKGLEWNLPNKGETEKIEASKDKFRGLGMQIIYNLSKRVCVNRYDEINESVIYVSKEV